MDIKQLMDDIERVALTKLNAATVKTAMELAIVLRTKEKIDTEMNFAVDSIKKLRGNEVDDCGDNHMPDTVAVLEFFRDVVYPGILERTKTFQMCADRADAEAKGTIITGNNVH